MSILSMCQWLQDTNIGTSIRESIWVFPIIETTHVLALSISVGLLLVSDLRLMGYIMKRRPVSEVYEQMKPWMFIGLCDHGHYRNLPVLVPGGESLQQHFLQDQSDSAGCRGHQCHRFRARHLSQEWTNGTTRWFRPWKPASPVGLPLILWAAIITCGRTMAYTF